MFTSDSCRIAVDLEIDLSYLIETGLVTIANATAWTTIVAAVKVQHTKTMVAS